MKVLLHDEPGDPFLPEELLRQVEKKKFIEQRIGSSVAYFEKFKIAKGTEAEFMESVKTLGRGQILRWDERDFYVGKGDGYYTVWRIVEVNTKKKWTIWSCKGKEYILNISDFDVANYSINYYEYKD